MKSFLLTVLAVACILGAAFILKLLLKAAFEIVLHSVASAFGLFGWAAQSGFIGIALYVLLWIVGAPLMIAICIVGGIVRYLIEKAAMRAVNLQAKTPLAAASIATSVNRTEQSADDR